MTGTSGSLYERLPHGHVDLNFTSGGRVLLLVNSSGYVADVLADLAAVQAQLQQLAGHTNQPPLAKLETQQ